MRIACQCDLSSNAELKGYLIVAPAVDLSVVALLVAIRQLALAGASREQIRPAQRLLIFCSLVTLALNTAEPIIEGHYGRAAFDAVGCCLLIGWSHIGPELLQALQVTARHGEQIPLSTFPNQTGIAAGHAGQPDPLLAGHLMPRPREATWAGYREQRGAYPMRSFSTGPASRMPFTGRPIAGRYPLKPFGNVSTSAPAQPGVSSYSYEPTTTFGLVLQRGSNRLAAVPMLSESRRSQSGLRPHETAVDRGGWSRRRVGNRDRRGSRWPSRSGSRHHRGRG
ncbi:hypothetical protein Franean1_3444 [Parafrankia sp. EAN1pec]|nr:hypothetical protein Franean1_3444 [Frankia sp. EAN1pec]